ncbi:hypothetical protein CRYUN_Cryun29cG0086900 [Craigia yunnanensis]
MLLVIASYWQMGVEARNVVSFRCHHVGDCKNVCRKCTVCICQNTWCKCPNEDPSSLPLPEVILGYQGAPNYEARQPGH